MQTRINFVLSWLFLCFNLIGRAMSNVPTAQYEEDQDAECLPYFTEETRRSIINQINEESSLDMVKLYLEYHDDAARDPGWDTIIAEFEMHNLRIANKDGRILLSFAMDSNFMSFGILAHKTLNIHATVGLPRCTFEYDTLKDSLIQLVYNFSLELEEFDSTCYFEVPDKAEHKILNWLYYPYILPNNFRTYCILKDGDRLEIIEHWFTIYVIVFAVLILSFLPVFLRLLPWTAKDDDLVVNYDKNSNPYSARRLLTILMFNGKMYNGTDSKDNSSLPIQTNENPNDDSIEELSDNIEKSTRTNKPSEAGTKSSSNCCANFDTPLIRLGFFFSVLVQVLNIVIHLIKHHFFEHETLFINQIGHGPRYTIYACQIGLNLVSLVVLAGFMVHDMFPGMYNDELMFCSKNDKCCVTHPAKSLLSLNTWTHKLVFSAERKCQKNCKKCCICILLRMFDFICALFLCVINLIFAILQLIPVIHLLIFLFNSCWVYTTSDTHLTCLRKRCPDRCIILVDYVLMFVVYVSIVFTGAGSFYTLMNPISFAFQIFAYTFLVGMPFYPAFSIGILSAVVAYFSNVKAWFSHFQKEYKFILKQQIRIQKEMADESPEKSVFTGCTVSVSTASTALEDSNYEKKLKINDFAQLCYHVHPPQSRLFYFFTKCAILLIYFIIIFSILSKGKSAANFDQLQKVVTGVAAVIAPFIVTSLLHSGDKQLEARVEKNIRKYFHKKPKTKSGEYVKCVCCGYTEGNVCCVVVNCGKCHACCKPVWCCPVICEYGTRRECKDTEKCKETEKCKDTDNLVMDTEKCKDTDHLVMDTEKCKDTDNLVMDTEKCKDTDNLVMDTEKCKDTDNLVMDTEM